mgnify:CR=1 FL=1
MINSTALNNQKAVEKARAIQLHEWIEKNKHLFVSELLKIEISLKGFKVFGSVKHSFDS